MMPEMPIPRPEARREGGLAVSIGGAVATAGPVTQFPARLGGWLVLAARDDAGEPEVISVAVEGDLLRLARAAGWGDAAVAQCAVAWCPEVRPRPDLADDARRWLEAMDDPLREQALELLRRGDGFRLLDLMPPLLGPGSVVDPSGCYDPVIVQPDGSAPALDPLPIAPDEPRRYALLWGNGPVLVVAWGDEVAMVQAFGPTAFRLRAAPGRLTVEPGADAPDAWAFLAPIWGRGCHGPDDGLAPADERLRYAVAGSLGLASVTHRGLLPRYGAGAYDRPEHNSFPPATLATVEAELACGRSAAAVLRLAAYLLRYVREDGSLDYYGPSLSEYGQLLDLAARASRAGEGSLLSGGCGRLLLGLARRAAGLMAGAQADGSLTPRGLPEADYTSLDPASEGRRYLSGGLWLLRGLVSWSRMAEGPWPGVAPAEPRMNLDEAQAWATAMVEAAALSNFLRADLDGGRPFERMTESVEASYTNYRFWPEMLSSGLMPREAEGTLVRWRQTHGGELMGMTRFGGHLDDWPVWHYAQGLLRLGDGETYTMLMWAHLLHHQMPGWLAAYEQASVAPDAAGWRTAVAGQVAPCQATAPLMLRAGLLWEDPDEDELWVLPAGTVFLRSLGGAAETPWVTTWAGPARLKVGLCEGGVQGTLVLAPEPGRPTAVVLPEGTRVTAASAREGRDEAEQAVHLAFRQEGRRVTVEPPEAPLGWVFVEFGPA